MARTGGISVNLDEFDYLVRNAQIKEGEDICFHVLNGAQITGTISRLARFANKVIGVELSYDIPQDVPPPMPDVFEHYSAGGEVLARESEPPVPVIAEPEDMRVRRINMTKPITAQTRVYVPASVVIAAEWVTR